MPHITIDVEEDVPRWARLRAAELDTTVACLIGNLLRDQMRASAGCEAARKRFVATQPRKLSQGPYPSRDELHDRASLR